MRFMKFGLKTRVLQVLVAVLMVAITTTSLAYAATVSRQVTGGFTVLTPTPGIEVYADAECTTPVDVVQFGSMYPGDSSAPMPVYVKNTGQVDFSSVAVSSGFTVNLGTFTYSQNNFALARDAVQQVDMTLTVASGADAGSYTPYVLFQGNY